MTIRWKDLHDNVGYSPYEGRQIKGWPITVVSRGRVVVEDGKLNAARGSGQFLPCASPDSAKPQGQTAPELAVDVALRPQAAVLMIGVDYARRMALYNRWQNENLYGAADGPHRRRRHRERGAFFGSIHRTMCVISCGPTRPG